MRESFKTIAYALILFTFLFSGCSSLNISSHPVPEKAVWEFWPTCRNINGTYIQNHAICQGDKYIALGRYKKALKEYSSTVDQIKSLTELEILSLRMAATYLYLKDPWSARETLREFYQNAGKSVNDMPGEAAFLVGITHAQQRESIPALKWLSKAMEREPHSHTIRSYSSEYLATLPRGELDITARTLRDDKNLAPFLLTALQNAAIRTTLARNQTEEKVTPPLRSEARPPEPKLPEKKIQEASASIKTPVPTLKAPEKPAPVETPTASIPAESILATPEPVIKTELPEKQPATAESIANLGVIFIVKKELEKYALAGFHLGFEAEKTSRPVAAGALTSKSPKELLEITNSMAETIVITDQAGLNIVEKIPSNKNMTIFLLSKGASSQASFLEETEELNTLFLQFLSAYELKHKELPVRISAEAFDVATFIRSLLKKEPDQSLKKSLTSISLFEGISADIAIGQSITLRNGYYLTVLMAK